MSVNSYDLCRATEQIPVYETTEQTNQVGTLYEGELFAFLWAMGCSGDMCTFQKISFYSPTGYRNGVIHHGGYPSNYVEEAFDPNASFVTENGWYGYYVRRQCRIWYIDYVHDYVYEGDIVYTDGNSDCRKELYGGVDEKDGTNHTQITIQAYEKDGVLTTRDDVQDDSCEDSNFCLLYADTDIPYGYSMPSESTTYGTWG